MRQFEFRALPWNVVFGTGALQRLPQVLDGLGLKRALVVATPEQAEAAAQVAGLLGTRAAGVFPRAVMHVPVETVAEALQVARECGADSSVSIGGGSTTGLGKALRLRAGLPHVAIPTTYAGSEMTNVWGMTEGGEKRTGRDVKVVPVAVIYDPELTLSLPPRIAGPSGMNALAHAVCNVCSYTDNPLVYLMALEAVRVLMTGLPRVVSAPDDIDARAESLYGACLAGATFGSGGTNLHYRLCHTIGGTFNMPHAETHAILLPHTVAYNAAAVPGPMARLAEAMGGRDPVTALHELLHVVSPATSLAQIGLAQADLDRAAAMTVAAKFPNPAPIGEPAVRALLDDAWHGRAPRRSP